jgi:hypothetical protein
MTAIVQGKCPGCNKLLRLPPDWLHQTLRCKHCGTILQGKPKISPSGDEAPIPVVEVKVPRPAVSTGEVRQAGIPVVVVSPVNQGEGAEPASVFAGLSDDAPVARIRRPRRGRRSTGWKLVGVSVFLGLACMAGAAYYAHRTGKIHIPGLGAPGNDQDQQQVQQTTTKPPALDGKVIFPRRALLVNVNNYLYANPVNHGSPLKSKLTLIDRLSAGLHIPPDQIAELSDAAARKPTPPLKAVIEHNITSFLSSSRPQDRILLVFVGHAVEIDEQPYLVPIEGELKVKETLIPLSWLYDQLKECPAKQKVLVLDVARFNPSHGTERPSGGPLGKKLDEALKAPPEGVQVWSSCVEGQNSYEFDDAEINDGLFLHSLGEVLTRGLNGVIQQPEDPFPLAPLQTDVHKLMKKELVLVQKEQTTRLTGEEAPGGAAYNPQEPPPSNVVVQIPADLEKNATPRTLIAEILREAQLPPIKAARDEMKVRVDALPPFPADKMEAYKADTCAKPFRDAVINAQTVLEKLSKDPEQQLQEEFRALEPMALAKAVTLRQQALARVVAHVNEALEDLQAVGKTKSEQSKRWQANYDLVLARIEEQVAYMTEYSALLAQLKKPGEEPKRDPKIHGGWRLASVAEPTGGDSTAKKLATDARKILDRVAKENPETPWAVLAKRERMTGLGLEWQPVR